MTYAFELRCIAIVTQVGIRSWQVAEQRYVYLIDKIQHRGQAHYLVRYRSMARPWQSRKAQLRNPSATPATPNAPNGH
jgi:hypothetical protein